MIEKMEKESLINVIGRFIKYNKIFTFLIIVIIIHIFVAIFSSKGLITKWKFQSETKELKNKLAKEKEIGDSLKKEIDELNNSNEKIEKIAREKYGMTKQGERIYKVIIDSTKK